MSVSIKFSPVSLLPKPFFFFSGTVATKNLCLYLPKEQQHPLWSTTRLSMLPGHSSCTSITTGFALQGWGAVDGQHSRHCVAGLGTQAVLLISHPRHPQGSWPCSFSPSRIDVTINCQRFIVQRLLTVIFFFLLTKSRSSL